jgi:hypothetical protein
VLKGIAELFVSRWCSWLILRSSLPPLSGRVAHYPERVP